MKTLAGKNMDKERKRHDLALEKYQNDYNTWKKEQGKRELWIEEQEKEESNATYKFQSTDEAFKKYAEAHPEDLEEEPNFHDYYSPSKDKKMEKFYSQFYQLQD